MPSFYFVCFLQFTLTPILIWMLWRWSRRGITGKAKFSKTTSSWSTGASSQGIPLISIANTYRNFVFVLVIFCWCVRTSFKAFMKMIHESNNLEMKHASAAFFEAIPSVNETHDSEVTLRTYIYTYIHTYIHYIDTKSNMLEYIHIFCNGSG